MAEGGTGINLMALSLDQLNQLKTSIEEVPAARRQSPPRPPLLPRA